MFGLNKLADRDFVVGFVLPVLLFCAAIAFLFRDTTVVGSIYSALIDLKSFTSLTMLVLVIWTLATLLMAWDTTIYRVLEGYVGPFKREKWRRAMEEKFDARKKLLANAHDEIIALKAKTTIEENTVHARERKYLRDYEEFRNLFPFRRDLVLPTRFGNVVRAFESYALNVYGVDGIPAWTRLAGVIPGTFASVISGARSEVNFFVNIWALSIAFVGISAGRLIFDLVWVALVGWNPIHWGAAISIFVGIVISVGAYESAIERGQAWGETVKSAFDLYLEPMAKQLGFALPAARRGERGQLAFWEAVTSMFLLQQPIRREDWPTASTEVGQQKSKAEEANR
jgi:hypothetical protein